MRAFKICIGFLVFACTFGEPIDNDVKSLLLNEIKRMGAKFDSLTEKIDKMESAQEEFKELAEKISKMETELAEFKGKHTRSDDTILEPVVTQLSQKVTQMGADLQSVKNTNTAQDHAITAQQQAIGSVYVRWGHDTCPESSDMVYSGYVGGSWFSHTGGGSNYLCLPPNPVFDGHRTPHYGAAELGGAEYETCDESTCNLNPVCAVCHTTHAATMMIPGTNTCQPGWDYEYSGYLMTDRQDHELSTEFICVDNHFGHLPGTNANNDGVLLYYTAVQCGSGSLPCPPYINGKTMLCVVCSK